MPETEAEALLRSGALYPFRVGLRPDDGPLLFAGLKHGVFSIYDGDAPIVHHDLDGRWRRCYREPTHYLHRLDGTVLAIDRPRQGRNMVLERRTLDQAEADRLHEALRSEALDLLDRLDSGSIALVDPPPPASTLDLDRLRDLLGRVGSWDAAAWADHRARYRSTYGPIPFQPPDCQEAIVLQATLGHSGGRAFGGVPADPLVVRTPDEFAAHCRAVADLLGLGAIPERSLFLAGADVARLPYYRIESIVRSALAVFPLADAPAPPRRSDLPVDRPHREGLQLFLDDPTPPLIEADRWRSLGALGLRRVTVGLASGDRSVRRDRGQSWVDDDLRALVGDLKDAGIAVSAVALLGVGGDDHERGTASLLGSLPLSAGDHVYLLDASELETPNRTAPEPRPAVLDQERRLLDALAPLRSDRRVRVLPYTTRKQRL